MGEVWQYKFVKSERHDPDETQRLFGTPFGWGKLGPTASERCQAAMKNPLPGVNYYMTLAPMISFKFHLVGHRPEGLTLCRFSTDLEAGGRCIAKPLNTSFLQLSAEVVSDGNKKCFVRFYTVGGEERVIIRNKTLQSRWGPVLHDATSQLGRTNCEFRFLKFVTMEGVEIKEQNHHDKLGEDLRLPAKPTQKMTRSKFSKN